MPSNYHKILHLASRSTLPLLLKKKAPLLFQTSIYIHNGHFSRNTKKNRKKELNIYKYIHINALSTLYQTICFL